MLQRTFATEATTRILNALRESPGLSPELIAERAFIGRSTLSGGGYLKKMKEAGLIHISGWQRNGSGSFSTPQYSAGAGEDLPRPKFTRLSRQSPGILRLYKAIEEFGPLDYRQAAKLACLAECSVKNGGYLETLVAQKKIRIVEWRPGKRGSLYPLYEVGSARSVPPPETLAPTPGLRELRRYASPAARSLVAQLQSSLPAP